MKEDLDLMIRRWMSGDLTLEEERMLHRALSASQSSLSPEEEAVFFFLDTALKGRSEEARRADAEQVLSQKEPMIWTAKKHFPLRKIAAVFTGLLLMSGLVWASVHFLTTEKKSVETENDSAAVSEVIMPTEKDTVQFSNIRLDSILTAVGKHYHRTVAFVDEEPRTLRFNITWNTEEPLATFLATVNEFEGLMLTDERDTLFVQSMEMEGDK